MKRTNHQLSSRRLKRVPFEPPTASCHNTGSNQTIQVLSPSLTRWFKLLGTIIFFTAFTSLVHADENTNRFSKKQAGFIGSKSNPLGPCTDVSILYRKKKRPQKAKPEGFAAHIADESHLRTTELTEQLTKRTLPQEEFAKRRWSFDSLSSYRDLARNIFLTHFSTISSSQICDNALASYSLNRKLEMPETFRLPFMPLSFEFDEPSTHTFYKIETDYKGRTVEGLRVRINLHRTAGPRCPETVYLPYIPDINAQNLGFKYGQLRLEISENIRTSPFFDYNGLRSWHEHNRLTQSDQSDHPIELTNIAHPSGSYKYVISTHPDFALMLEDYYAPYTRMTFFLWKNEPNQEQNQTGVPDFIYQVELTYLSGT